MAKAKLFEDGEDFGDVSLSVNKSYATNYQNWRQKEELQKLKDKYGDVGSSGSESSSEIEDDDAKELTPAVKLGFFKTLAALKTNDESLYDPKTTFYAEGDDNAKTDSSDEETPSKMDKEKAKKPNTKPLYLKDYERTVVVKKEGRYSDEEESDEQPSVETGGESYAEQQKRLKESFKAALDSDSDEDLLKRRGKSEAEMQKEDDDYMEWLKGQKTKPKDKTVAKSLKRLRKFWTDPNLDDDEKFLRDYLLNERYKDPANEDAIPTYEEIVEDAVPLEEDEQELKKEEVFERKFNFRFEEEDKEFIKSYPRTVGDSIRRQNDKRKMKRNEYRDRKIEEKRKKEEEIKQLKNLKKKELMDRLKKIQEISGNEKLPLAVDDLENDFDPADYDAKMKAIFDNDYYDSRNEDGDEKPEFSDSDPEENWDEYTDIAGPSTSGHSEQPLSAKDNAKKRLNDVAQASFSVEKQDKRQNRFKEALRRQKPLFDPGTKTFEEYFDDYYKLDYEDIIGDLPCRFKYRKVPENDFGLSVDEVLRSGDKELNAWVSLKKMTAYRDEQREVYDIQAYQKRAANLEKKKKILKSYYGSSNKQSVSNEVNAGTSAEKEYFEPQKPTSSKNSISRKRKRSKSTNETGVKNGHEFAEMKSKTAKLENLDAETQPKRVVSKKEQRKKQKYLTEADYIQRLSDDRLKAYGLNPKKVKDKIKYSKRYQEDA